MAETVRTQVGASYTKVVDTAVTAFTLQNSGASNVYVIFTDGAAPADTEKGILLRPDQGVLREHGDGDVYAKQETNNPSIVTVVS